MMRQGGTWILMYGWRREQNHPQFSGARTRVVGLCTKALSHCWYKRQATLSISAENYSRELNSVSQADKVDPENQASHQIAAQYRIQLIRRSVLTRLAAMLHCHTYYTRRAPPPLPLTLAVWPHGASFIQIHFRWICIYMQLPKLC